MTETGRKKKCCCSTGEMRLNNQHRGSGGLCKKVSVKSIKTLQTEPQLSGCNPPPCVAPACSSCHTSDSGSKLLDERLILSLLCKQA